VSAAKAVNRVSAISASLIQTSAWASQTALGYRIGVHADSSIPAIAATTEGYWLMVIDTATPACRQAETSSPM
jgi:hypothetical protein